jgi:ribonuclease T
MELPPALLEAFKPAPRIGQRFRGFLPVVVDVETGGFNNQTDALLEIAAVMLKFDRDGNLVRDETHHAHIEPFRGANIEKASLEVNGIDPNNPLRGAILERDALAKVFKPIRQAVSEHNCTRAILVGHNAHFDLGFLNAAVGRCDIKRNPFHPFSAFDTATLGGAILGQTVLARALDAAGLPYNNKEAHSAVYDAERTADLFCLLINRLRGVHESFVGTAVAESAS